MKINFGKVLRVLGRVIVAAPVIIEAVKPVLRKRKARRRDGVEAIPAPPTRPDDTPGVPAAPT